MKWWPLLSAPESNSYNNADTKDQNKFRIELMDCSMVTGEHSVSQPMQGNFFKQLEKGISVDEQVEQFLTGDNIKSGTNRMHYSRINARCHEVLNFFLLNTFKEGLKYIIVCNMVWFVCLMFKPRATACLGIVILLTLVTTAMLTTTYFKVYYDHQATITVVYAVVLCIASLSHFSIRYSYSEPTLYIWCCTVLVLLYTVLPLRGVVSLVIAVSYTVLFELCYFLVESDRSVQTNDSMRVITRVLLQVMSHGLGLYITHQYQAHSECLIYNTTRHAMAKERLRRERKLKEKVISSVVPPSIGHKLAKIEQSHFQGVHIFRPMVMHYLNNVSILFADIVGFTKMSSTLRAIEIVSMLNRICDRFDTLTADAGCTKISTLGDCYYCVAGCPDKMANHAPAIVGLGLKLLTAIEDINSEIEHNISIRIGIHTGSVLCGVVGIKRFKFDVWSHDVLRANQMESSGLPGKVHISEATCALVKETFLVTDGHAQTRCPTMEGIKTYFVLGTIDSVKPAIAIQISPKKGKGRGIFKLRFHSSSDGQSSLRSLDEHLMKLKSFSTPEPVIRRTVSERNATDQRLINYSRFKDIFRDRSQTGNSPGEDGHLFTDHGDQLVTSCDMRARTDDDSPTDQGDTLPTNHSKSSYHKPHASFSEAICTDRKVTDTEVMSHIRTNKSPSAFGARSNLNVFTLHFHDGETEELYRKSTVLKYPDGSQQKKRNKKPSTSFQSDIMVSLVYLVCVGVVILLSLPLHTYWVVCFVMTVAVEVLVLAVVVVYMRVVAKKHKILFSALPTSRVLPWLPRNIISVTMVILPFVVISLRVLFGVSTCNDADVIMFLYTSAFVHGINFLQVLGLLKILVLLTLAGLISPFVWLNEPFSGCYSGGGEALYKIWDIPISISLLFLLISMVIRTFELRIRLNFSSKIEAEKDQALHQKLRDQAYWLLENLIPNHVLLELKRSGSYHRDHDDVAVCFASIVNFQDFFDAEWKHGHDSIRILNELISDIDELLNKPKYNKHIEKIKTALGCTYMAASGLVHEDPGHIFVMMEFLFDIKKVLVQFNKYTMGFEFRMKFGCHLGAVASGVIGQSAPMFDIWGDTVNIASRMMTTGVIGKIQVLKDTVDVIESRYTCAERGVVFIKGKGDIITYFVVQKTPPIW